MGLSCSSQRKNPGIGSVGDCKSETSVQKPQMVQVGILPSVLPAVGAFSEFVLAGT